MHAFVNIGLHIKYVLLYLLWEWNTLIIYSCNVEMTTHTINLHLTQIIKRVGTITIRVGLSWYSFVVIDDVTSVNWTAEVKDGGYVVYCVVCVRST
jgi:hypothetical protein